MASVIDKDISVEFARRLLTMSKTELGMSRIPVRYTLEFGPKLHWQKGELVGVNGVKLFIHPRTTHHGGKIEPTDPDKVHLWTSQMDKKMLALVNAIRTTLAEEAALAAEAARKAAADTEANQIALNAALVANPTESPPEIDVARFATEFTTYLSLKKQLIQTAASEGIGYLARLRSDYFEALDLAEIAKSDMAELVPELEVMGVQIPPELIDILQPPPEPEPLPLPEPIRHVEPAPASSGNIQQLHQVFPTPNTTWCNGLAKQLERAILEYMYNRAGQMLKGPAIFKGIGVKVSTPSSVLAPLVHKGAIQMYGARAGTRYRVVLTTKP